MVDNYDDLKAINLQLLMLARDCARHNPMAAIFKFNLNQTELEKISTLSIDEIADLAECGRAVFRTPPVLQIPHGVSPSVAAALLAT